MSETILVVEDEPPMLDSIAFHLEKEGYRVLQAVDGAQALTFFQKEEPDLVILDLMLPKVSGLEVARIIRADSSVPILVLTARGDEMDKVVGLDMGADDYVVKPVGMRELLARVRALLRRSGSLAESVDEVLQSGGLVMDVARHEVRVEGRDVSLSPKEFELLRVLLSRRGRVVTREFLLDTVWGNDFFGDPRTVDVHIRWLRGKIEAGPSNPVHIETVRGVGYKLADERT